jgi:flagellar basal-body rod modification protein FlgD
VSIADANGQVLKTVALGAQAAGTATFDWDGKTDAGADAGAGPFTVSAVARNGTTAVASRTLVWAPVQSVSLSSGSPVLDVGGVGPIPVTAVRQIG